MPHPDDNGHILSDLSDIRAYEHDQGKAEQREADAADIAAANGRALSAERAYAELSVVANELREERDQARAEYAEHMRTVHGEDPDPDPDPDPREDLGKIIGGTWALEQTNAKTDNLKTTFTNCANRAPSIIGFGIRSPLRDLTDSAGNFDPTLVERHVNAVHEINQQLGKAYILSLRPIAGQYLPAAWGAQMPAELRFTEAGKTGVHPCHPDGRPNEIYEAWWRKWLQQLFAWRESNPRAKAILRFVHGTYYAFEWSEYYNGPPTQPAPRGRAQYNQAAHRNAHLRLVSIMHDEQPDDVATEWATTGHGPMVGSASSPGSNPFIEALTDHIVDLYGSGSDRIYLSYNGWSQTKIAGAPDAATEHAKQWAGRTRENRRGDVRAEIQDIAAGSTIPWDSAYEWAFDGADDRLGNPSSSFPARRTLGKNFNGQGDTYLRNGVFPIEIYTYRFPTSAANSGQIEANARAHREHVLALFEGED